MIHSLNTFYIIRLINLLFNAETIAELFTNRLSVRVGYLVYLLLLWILLKCLLCDVIVYFQERPANE